MTRAGLPGLAVVLAVTATLLAFAPASAQAVSPAAEALFQDGRRLLTDGQIDKACERFTESFALDASSGTLLNLALCHEKQGKIATAWAEYRGAARLARAQGRDDRASAADDKIAALEPRLPRLTSIAAKTVRGLKVAIDNHVLGEGGLGVAVPVDPGLHKITVSASGRRPWATSVELMEGEQRALEIPELEVEPAPAPVRAGAGQLGLAAPGAATASTPAPERSRLNLYLVGGGGVLLVGSAVVWAVAYAKLQSAIDACNDVAGCSTEDYDSRTSTITTLKWVVVGSFIAGGCLLVASGVRAWISRRPQARARSVSIGIDPVGAIVPVGAVGGGLSLRGVF